MHIHRFQIIRQYRLGLVTNQFGHIACRWMICIGAYSAQRKRPGRHSFRPFLIHLDNRCRFLRGQRSKAIHIEDMASDIGFKCMSVSVSVVVPPFAIPPSRAIPCPARGRRAAPGISWRWPPIPSVGSALAPARQVPAPTACIVCLDHLRFDVDGSDRHRICVCRNKTADKRCRYDHHSHKEPPEAQPRSG